jgi:ketosteroid isomerase-like protein
MRCWSGGTQEVESTGGLFQDESRAALERFRSRIPTDEAALGTRRGAVDARNRLYNLQRDLVSFTPENPYTVDLAERDRALALSYLLLLTRLVRDAAADAVIRE